MGTSIASAVRWWSRTDGDRAALRFGADVVTYRSLGNWSSRVARALVDRGVAPGDRVGLLGGNTPEWAAAAYGVIKAGGVLVPLNPRLVAAELDKLRTDSGLTLVVTEDAHREKLGDVPQVGLDEITALRDGADDDFQLDRAPDEPIALLFTSGSTGLSKGVVCTNRTLLDIVFEASLTQEGLRPGGSSLLLLPLCFTPGLVWGLVMSTVLGGTLVVEPQLDPARAVRLIAEHRIGTLFGVPLIWEALAATPEFADADLSSLKTAVVGGAAVSVPLLRAWAGKGVALRQIYGMTEAGGIATATLPKEAADLPGSCGSGSIFTDLKVVRPDGSEAAPGEQGEVLLRGPGVTPGYWNDPETTAHALKDGWLHSGDLGVRDEEGRLTFVDRLKDLIISGGINISPVEIEAVISGVPGVTEVAVIAAKDDRFGETPAAIVSGTAGVEEIVDACGERMADYKVPRYVVVTPEPLPRLASGKLSKRAIRDEYADVTERFEKVR